MIIILMVLIFYCNSHFLLADKFDEMEKRLNEKMDKIEEKFDKASRRLDEKFARALSEEWFNVKFKDGELFYPDPKPVKVPKAPPISRFFKVDKTPLVNVPIPLPVPVKEPVDEPLPAKPLKDEYNIQFDFLGTSVTVTLPEKIKSIKSVSLNNKSIAEFWEKVCSYNHQTTFKQLNNYQKSLLKNDWAYLMFLEIMSKEIFSGKENLQNLYTWFLLIKTGYQARIGYDEKKIYLLLPTTTMIYGKSYFNLDGNNFYKLSTQPVKEEKSSIYTYPGKYPGSDKMLELRIKEWPALKQVEKERKLTFKYQGKKYVVTIIYEYQIVSFVKDYPQTTIDAYAGAPLSDLSKESFFKEIAKLVDGKSETSAVNLLLSFVQNSFSYKTDQQQFGYEKWFFAEETLNYPYSDCEDRSVIFGRLVKEFLGLEVVFLHYPKHMAVAVHFSKPVKGDKVKYKDKWYIICDPTYIGATYGKAMPQFKNVSPEITEI